MKNSVKLIISAILCVLIAAGCFFWATGMISSNFNYRSPIHNTPPDPDHKLGDPDTQRLVIVLIDGLRYDTSQKTDTMPTLAHLRDDGASARMLSQPPSFSETGYSTIFTGAWPWMNDGPAFNLPYDEIPTWTQDNLFTAAHDIGIKTAISGYYWFEKLVPQKDVDLSFYTPGEDKQADEDVVNAALPWLQNNEAQLVLIHLDQVDYAGHHEGGPKSIAWDQAAQRADDLLAQIVATLDFKNDTLLVISDHGHIDAGGHGGQDAICLQEPFVVMGAGVNPGIYADINMVDVAPTMAALLGTRIPASTQGTVRTDIISPDKSVMKNISNATINQQTNLLRAYAKAINRTYDKTKLPTTADVNGFENMIETLRANRKNDERVPRGLIVVIILVLFFKWLSNNKKNGAVAWIIGAFTFAILFNFRYAMWDKYTYSLSSITDQNQFILYVATTSLIASAIVWMAITLDQRIFKLNSQEAALKTFYLFLTVAIINGLPAMVSYVANGLLVTWDLPNYLTSFLALLSLIQVLAISISGLIFAGVNALLAKVTLQKNDK